MSDIRRELDTVRVAGLKAALARKGWQLVIKRVIDVVGSGVALILVSPLFLLTALAVRLTSPGPALFRQRRLGLDNREFTIYKFRSMCPEAGAGLTEEPWRETAPGHLRKTRDDPRITALGRLLRRTSLDELPQLLNVLAGDMSLVGPRPLIPFMLEPHPAFKAARGLVRPGLTGLWQLRARHDNTSARAMMPHDLEYIADFSLLLDFGILARTVPAVLRRQGAV